MFSQDGLLKNNEGTDGGWCMNVEEVGVDWRPCAGLQG